MNNLNTHVLRQALDAVPVAALIVDARAEGPRVLYANPAFAQISGYSTAELHGQNLAGLLARERSGLPGEICQLKTRHGQVLALVQQALYDQPGRAGFWLLVQAGGLPRQGGAADTGEYSSAVEGLGRMPREERIDSTTGIPARSAFLEVLARDWAMARREQRRLSIALFRMVDFDSYHALFGRHAADACLRKVAHAIATSLRRSSDFCARIGQADFAVLISAVDEARLAEFSSRIAQRVRDLAIHHPRSAVDRYVTVAGAVASETPGTRAADPTLLLERVQARLGEVAEAPPSSPGDGRTVGSTA